MKNLLKVLCISKNDVFRGPVMTGYFKIFLKELAPDIIVESAGLTALDGQKCSKFVKELVKDFDLSSHQSRAVDHLDLSQYRSIYCLDEWIYNQVVRYQGIKNADIKVINKENGGIKLPENIHYYESCIKLIKKEVVKLVGLK